jgi:osmotically-inducible protein OsmY
MSELTVVEAVRAELKRLGQADNIEVHAHDGVVTLEGSVASRPLKRVIGQEILRLPQVNEVRNELRTPLPALDLSARLRALLQAEAVVASGIRIEAQDGVIRLAGEAEGWFDRDAAERLAWTLPGVRTVINEIAIPPDAPDPQAAEQRP